MLKRVYTILMFLYINTIFSQEEKELIHIDHNLKEVSVKGFNNKLETKLFTVIYGENKNVKIKKLHYREFFGKLDKKLKNYLNKLYANKFKVDSTKTWLIHYIDSLPKIEDNNILRLHNLKIGLVPFNARNYRNKLYKIKYKNFKKHLIRKQKKYKKEDIYLLHFYNKNKGYPINKAIKDGLFPDYKGLLVKTFTDGIQNYRTIVVYPNGDFYMSWHPYYLKDEKEFLDKTMYFKKKNYWLNSTKGI